MLLKKTDLFWTGFSLIKAVLDAKINYIFQFLLPIW